MVNLTKNLHILHTLGILPHSLEIFEQCAATTPANEKRIKQAPTEIIPLISRAVCTLTGQSSSPHHPLTRGFTPPGNKALHPPLPLTHSKTRSPPHPPNKFIEIHVCLKMLRFCCEFALDKIGCIQSQIRTCLMYPHNLPLQG